MRSKFIFSIFLLLLNLIFIFRNVGVAQENTMHTYQIPFDISCPDSSQCHDSVAAIVDLKQTNKISFCTGFVIGTDLISTNRHCINENYFGQDCSALKVRFPMTAMYPQVDYECEKILVASGPLNKKVNTDMAVFKVKTPIMRPILKISQDGFKNGEFYKIYKMNIQPKENESIRKIFLQMTECRALQKTIVFPEIMGDFYNIAFFNPCKVIGGNSGSPIIAKNGLVNGIISNSFLAEDANDGSNKEYSQGSSSHFSQQDLNKNNDNTKTMSMFAKSVFDKVMSNSGYGTNFGCIDMKLSTLNLHANPDCRVVSGSDVDRKISSNEIIQKGLGSIQNELNHRIKDLLKTLSKRGLKDYVWTYEPTSLNIQHSDVMDLIRVIPKPVCWLNHMTEPRFTFLPVYYMRLKLNSELQYQSEFTEINYKFYIQNQLMIGSNQFRQPSNLVNISNKNKTTLNIERQSVMKVVLKTEGATSAPFGISELARPMLQEFQIKKCVLAE